MKNLWNRLKYSIQADLHSMLDKKEKKNPIAMLNQYIREAEKETDEVGKLLERQGKLRTELEKELNEARAMADKRRHQLILAKNTEVTDLISFAESEVYAYETRVNQLTDSIQETVHELLSLEHKFETMKHKIKDMKVRQLSLMGKENVLRANHRMDQVIVPEEAKQNLSTFEEMQQYVENLSGQIDQEHKISSMERRLEALEITGAKESNIV